MRWLGAILGYIYFRFLGAIVGYFLGYFLEKLFFGGVRGRAVFTSRHRSSSIDLELNLLSLSSIVIKADGNVASSELRFVRNYFISHYGAAAAENLFSVFNNAFKKDVDVSEVCSIFRLSTSYSVRLQIIHFLFGIANSDGVVSTIELLKLSEISALLHINDLDFESIKAMFIKRVGNAYKILEIDRSATEGEIKKAYRTMAKKYHPDKLVHADATLKKGGQEKFREVQKAYETIRKERGF